MHRLGNRIPWLISDAVTSCFGDNRSAYGGLGHFADTGRYFFAFSREEW
jgi:hypothetical protein